MSQARGIFGLLSYSTFNLGDQIQSIAARRFLPRIDRYVDREALDEFQASDEGGFKLIMNGWYCHRPDRWPPSKSIDPLFVSFHISDLTGDGSGLRAQQVFAESPEILDYLRDHGPIGARDHHTRHLLDAWGVLSYFSGCLTLTLERPSVERQAESIVFCDVADDLVEHAQRQLKTPIQRTRHRDETTHGIEARMVKAQALLDLYAKASCVVTTRLHCALPCLAMGTPVLLLDVAPDKYRFSGLIDLVHHCSPEEFISGSWSYDMSNPPPNPNSYIPMRDDLISTCESFIGR